MISIIIPVYNDKFNKLDFTLRSLADQTSKNFEVILVSDGDRSDLNENIELSYHKYYYNISKLTKITVSSNYGPSVARNIGFIASQGDIISYLDVGDEYLPFRVELMEKLFEGEIMFMPYIVEENGQNGYYGVHLWADRNDPNSLLKRVEKENICIPLGFCHSRKAWHLIGGFQPGIVCGEDGIFIRRLLERIPDHEVKIIEGAVTAIYHISQEGQSRTQRRFDMGGFAFDASHPEGSHGQYLDEDWFETYSSEKWYEK